MTTITAADLQGDGLITQFGGDPALLKAELLHVITDEIANHPRSQQTLVGPSEVGTACDRRLAYKLLDTPEANRRGPNWKSTVGSAIHEWLGAAFLKANARDCPRWLVECKVSTGIINGDDLEGSCDLYDRVTGTVLDWKTTSQARLRNYRANGPGEQYRIQAALYAKGWRNAGFPVDRTAIFFLPRDGDLSDHYYWTEPYDEQLALDALARLQAIHTTTTALGPVTPAVMKTADAFCTHCPWYSPGSTDLTRGCPGDAGRATSPDPITTLI